MCGIAGIIETNSPRFAVKEVEYMLKGMLNAIRHRGPDDEGIFINKGIGLGSRRLSILDLSSAGHMPMIDSETGNCIVHNGEVYNYKELKQSLGLTGFKSKTDTEVILKSYRKYGRSCVEYFNGMFAFCIWDEKNKQLFCARDRLGIKPFYYAIHNDVFYFASEIKSLLKAGIPCEANMEIIYDYLVYGVYEHSEETFFKGIKQLPAGYTLTVKKNQFLLKKYWDLNIESEVESSSWFNSDNHFYKRAGEKFVEIFEDSLNLRLRSDVPIAVHISGGLDSTIMLSSINRVHGGQGRLKAFSYYFGEKKYDEKPIAEEVAKKAGWTVEFLKLSSSEIPELTEKAMLYQEQPFPGIITLAKHKLIENSQYYGAKVVLEGQGGDDIGGGYQYVFGSYVLDLIQAGQADLALREIDAFGQINGLNEKQSFVIFVNSLASYYKTGRSADGTHYVKTHCLQDEFITNYTHELNFPKPFKSNLLNMQYRDIRYTKLPRILRACDRASMAFSKELRVPFLDHRLVEFMFFLPGTFKIRNGVQRAFMRDVTKNYFPTWVSDIPKRAVVDPQREWLKDNLRDWVTDILHSESIAKRGIFDIKEVKKEYDMYKESKNPLNSFHIWQWISLELWFRLFIDAKNNN